MFRVSDCCLISNFSWQDQVNFHLNDDGVIFLFIKK
jgi:hypothetical protein